MGRKCSVIGCRTNYARTKKDKSQQPDEDESEAAQSSTPISIHRFPDQNQKPTLRAAWLKALNRTNFTDTQAHNGGICSRHFHPSDISYLSKNQRRDPSAGLEIQRPYVAEDAVPDRYLGYAPYEGVPTTRSPRAGTAAKLKERDVKRKLLLAEEAKKKEAKKEAKRRKVAEAAVQAAAEKVRQAKAELTFEAVEQGCQSSAWYPLRDQDGNSLRLLLFSVSDMTRLLAEIVIRDSLSWRINILSQRDMSLELQLISEHGIKPTELSSLAEVETLKTRTEAAAREAQAASEVVLEAPPKPCPTTSHGALILLRQLYKAENKEEQHRWLLEQLELMRTEKHARRFSSCQLGLAQFLRQSSRKTYERISQSGHIVLPTLRTLQMLIGRIDTSEMVHNQNPTRKNGKKWLERTPATVTDDDAACSLTDDLLPTEMAQNQSPTRKKVKKRLESIQTPVTTNGADASLTDCFNPTQTVQNQSPLRMNGKQRSESRQTPLADDNIHHSLSDEFFPSDFP